MVAGLGIIELRLQNCRSLKEKRGLLKGLLNRTQREFNVSLAEVGDNDRWSKALIGFATVSNDRQHLNGRIDRMINFMTESRVAEITGASFELININTDHVASEYEAAKYE